MIEKTLKELEERIRRGETIPEEKQKELLRLLSALKAEVNELAKTKGEAAESIADFTRLSTREAVRGQKNQDLLDISLQGLRSSATEFETSHPRLSQAVNTLANMLSNMGI